MEDPPRSKSRPSYSSSSAIRFIGILKQPVDAESSPLELDEVDVVWSTTGSDLPDAHAGDSSVTLDSPSNSFHRPFPPDRLGLSAAFSDDPASLLQRKLSLNPSVSAANAARAVPPSPLLRSGSGSDDLSRSAPVNVPAWPRRNHRLHWRSSLGAFDAADGDEEAEEEMLPPHLIVARSNSNSFSVFEGAGRTLKGRDMRRVRDAVWQKTGFMD